MHTAYLDTLIDALTFQVESSEAEVRELADRLASRLTSRLVVDHPPGYQEVQGMGSMIDVAGAKLHERREFLKLLESLKAKSDIQEDH